jgi:type I restriction enzyme R subunit
LLVKYPSFRFRLVSFNGGRSPRLRYGEIDVGYTNRAFPYSCTQIQCDNIEAVYKKLQERRDTADVTELLKELHKIVNEAIRAQAPGEDHAEGLTVDLSQIDFAKLRDEVARKVRRKHAAPQDIRDIVEKKLADMLARNPMRMDYYKKYQEIIADYNREKDRVTVEQTFARLVELAKSLDDEQKRAVQEGLSEDEYAMFPNALQREHQSDRTRKPQTSQ